VNRLRGRISHVESNGFVSLVDVTVGPDSFAAILLENPDSAPYLAAGRAVEILFKETEVSLAKNLSGLISLRNRMKATVRQVRRGAILSEVEMDYQGAVVTSIVTTRSIDRLGVAPGDTVEALVKANEVTLMEADHEL
jgi:molybdate transport system regulatory protein